MPISAELKRIYASAPTDVDYVETLEFSHPRFSKTYYFTNDVHSWDFLDENGQSVTFEVMPFEIQLPQSNNSGAQELQVAMCNVGLEMMDELESANQTPDKNITCVYRVYLNRPNSQPQNIPVLSLFISDISADELTVTATASRFDVLSKGFPTKVYTTDNFPGLKR